MLRCSHELQLQSLHSAGRWRQPAGTCNGCLGEPCAAQVAGEPAGVYFAISFLLSHMAFSCNLQVDYYLALDAHQTVVNSASTLGALLIMERWQAGRYATYYNGGNIPLEAHIPLYR